MVNNTDRVMLNRIHFKLLIALINGKKVKLKHIEFRVCLLSPELSMGWINSHAGLGTHFKTFYANVSGFASLDDVAKCMYLTEPGNKHKNRMSHDRLTL